MNQVEGIFVTEGSIELIELPNLEAKVEKIKLGEIFHLRDNTFTLNCVHCLQEFQYFSEFTLHIEEHYLSGHIERWKLIGDDIATSATETVTKLEQLQLNVNDDSTIKNDDFINNCRFISTNSANEMPEKEEIVIKYEEESPESVAPNDDDFYDYMDSMDHFQDGGNDDASTSVYVNEKNEQLLIPRLQSISSKLTPPGRIKRPKSNRTLLSNSLAMEISIGNGRKKFECSLCTRHFASKKSLGSHQKLHKAKDAIKPFSCPLCMLCFARPYGVERHIGNVHGINDLLEIRSLLGIQLKKKTYECLVCRLQITNKKILRKHMQSEHKLQIPKYIKKTHNFRTINAVRSDTLPFRVTHEFECFVCHRKFATIRGVRNHLSRHEPRTDLPKFPCPLCSLHLSKAHRLERHIYKVHGVSESHSIKAILAGRVESSKNDIDESKSDIKKENDKSPETEAKEAISYLLPLNFECFICHREVATLKALRNHLRYVHGPRRYICPVCHLRFSKRHGVERHIQSKHSESEYFSSKMRQQKRISEVKKPFMCDFCGWTFKSRVNLNDHLGRHTDNKNVKCDICNKMFSARYAQDHMKIHTGEKEHQCTICGSRFLTKQRLRQHSIRHGGEQKFKCDICNRGFARPSNLLAHRRTHPEEMPHICKTCNQGFVSFNSLRVHEYKHNRDDKRKVATGTATV